MGASASADSHLSMDEVKNLPEVGSKFNERVFHVYKDGNNKISRRISSELSKMRQDVFFSFSRGHDDLRRSNTDRVRAFADGMTARNISSTYYPDGEQSSTNFDKIDRSQIVFVCVTRAYEQGLKQQNNSSEQCIKEFLYAQKVRAPKFMFPLIMEPSMKDQRQWTGPLKTLLGGVTAIDCCRDENLNDIVSDICNFVHDIIVPLHDWNLAKEGSPRLSTSSSTPVMTASQGLMERDLNVTTIERLTRELETSKVEAANREQELFLTKKELQHCQHEVEELRSRLSVVQLQSQLRQSASHSSMSAIGLTTSHRVSASEKSRSSSIQHIPDIAETSVVEGNDVGASGVGFEGKCTQVLAEHTHYIYSLAVAKNGDVFSGSRDKTIRQWRQADSSMDTIQTFTGHSNWVTCLLVYDLDDLLVSGSLDKTIKIWQISSGACMNTLTEHTAEVCCFIPWDRGTFISGGCDQLLRMWDLPDGNQIKTVSGAKGDIWCLVKVREDVIAGGEYDEGNCIRIYCVSKGTVLQVLSGHDDWVRGLAIGVLDELISVSKDCTMKVWSQLDDGSYAASRSVQHPMCEWGLLAIMVLPDGSYVTASNDQKVRIWSASNGYSAPTKEFEGHTNTVRCLAQRSGNEIVSAGDDKTVRIWV